MLLSVIKRCTHCNLEKPSTEYHNSTKRKDGKYPRCVSCRRAESIQNREKRRAYNQKYYTENSAKISQRWFENRENNLARHGAYYQTIRGRAVRLLNSAKKSPDGCTLTLDHVMSGIEREVCPVTGFRFDLRTDERSRSGRHTNPFAPSLDRVDPTLGYTNENTRVVVWQYNFMKGELSDADVLAMCKVIVARNSA